MKLVLVPTTVEQVTDVPDGVEIVTYDPRQPIPDAFAAADVLVVWGNPANHLRDAATRLTNVRWVQTMASGPDAVLAAGFDESVLITSGRGLQRLPVAEHALALILAAARRLHELRDAQSCRTWSPHLSGLQRLPDPDQFRSLIGATVGILGYGAIGAQLGRYLRMLGASIVGIASSARADGEVDVVSTADLPSVAATSDVLVMLLPSNTKTNRIVDAAVLSSLPRHAWVVNVGRGQTLDTDALVDALRAERLGGAALDVFDVEPLPRHSPLWHMPNVIITPHAAGGRPMGTGAFIADNLRRFVAGEPLRNPVTG